MSIYVEMLERVENGEKFYINFEKRIMKVGGKVIIDKGEYDTSKKLYEGEIYSLDALLSIIKALYKKYKYSLPSERSDNKRRKYFKALSVDELTDEQLIIGQPREVAQFTLEAFVLCTILNGDFVWNEEVMGKWFYQHPLDQDLVILRNWIEGK